MYVLRLRASVFVFCLSWDVPLVGRPPGNAALSCDVAVVWSWAVAGWRVLPIPESDSWGT